MSLSGTHTTDNSEKASKVPATGTTLIIIAIKEGRETKQQAYGRKQHHKTEEYDKSQLGTFTAAMARYRALHCSAARSPSDSRAWAHCRCRRHVATATVYWG